MVTYDIDKQRKGRKEGRGERQANKLGMVIYIVRPLSSSKTDKNKILLCLNLLLLFVLLVMAESDIMSLLSVHMAGSYTAEPFLLVKTS